MSNHGATIIFWIALVVCSAIGAFNQLLGALILIVVGFVIFISVWTDRKENIMMNRSESCDNIFVKIRNTIYV